MSVVELSSARRGPLAVVRAAPGSRALAASTVAVLLGGILLVGAAYRVVSFRGYWGADDGEYARLANAMAHGQYWSFVDTNYIQAFNAPAHLPYRSALVVPLSLLFRTFGVSEATLVAYPLLLSTLGIVIAFLCGRHFFGDRAGLLAAALWAVVPVDVDYATSFLPDGIASFYASAGVVVAIVWTESRSASMRARFVAGLGAGLLFGVSWLAKESVTYLVPFCGLLMVMGFLGDAKRALPFWLGVAVASGGVLASEMLYYAAVRGDFMVRMHENERSFVQTQSYLFYEGSRFGWPVGGSRAKALVDRLFVSGPAVMLLDIELLYLPFVGLVAGLWAWWTRDRAFLLPAAWLVILLLMYDFFSPSFATYTPLVLLHRYLLPLVLPAAVLTAGLLVRLLESGADARRRIGWGLAVAIGAVCAWATLMEVRDLRRTKPMYEVRQVASIVRPGDTVYTDPLSRKALEFQWRFPETTGMRDFEGQGAEAIAPGSYVLVDANRLGWLSVNVSMWLTKDYGYHAPAFAKNAPPAWKVAWRNPYATLYRVD